MSYIQITFNQHMRHVSCINVTSDNHHWIICKLYSIWTCAMLLAFNNPVVRNKVGTIKVLQLWNLIKHYNTATLLSYLLVVNVEAHYFRNPAVTCLAYQLSASNRTMNCRHNGIMTRVFFCTVYKRGKEKYEVHCSLKIYYNLHHGIERYNLVIIAPTLYLGGLGVESGMYYELFNDTVPSTMAIWHERMTEFGELEVLEIFLHHEGDFNKPSYTEATERSPTDRLPPHFHGAITLFTPTCFLSNVAVLLTRILVMITTRQPLGLLT
jgi:hypothetical protein